MGIIRPLAAKTDAHWRLAQKTSGNWFLMGLLMALIIYYLKTSQTYELFLIEMLLLVFPIMPILL